MACRILVLLTAILAALPALGEGDVAVPREPLPTLQGARQADPEELARVVAESRVETSPATPGLALYVRDAAEVVSGWLVDLLERYLPGFGRFAGWFLKAVPALLYGLLALLAGILVARLVRRWWRDRRPQEPSPVRTLPAVGAGDAERRDAAWWEGELRRRLAAEELGAALEALWWWLARVLESGLAGAGTAAPADVERSWTSRELISRAGRPDLRPLVGRLDRLIYGPDVPTAGALRRMFGDLKEAVG